MITITKIYMNLYQYMYTPLAYECKNLKKQMLYNIPFSALVFLKY